MLEKRCKKGTGEDWQKIALVPELESTPEEIYFSNLLNPLLISSLFLCSTDTFVLRLVRCLTLT